MVEPVTVRKEAVPEPRCIGCKRTPEFAKRFPVPECQRPENARPDRCLRLRLSDAIGGGTKSDDIAALRAEIEAAAKRVTELEEQVKTFDTAADEHRKQTEALNKDLASAQSERDQARREADEHKQNAAQQAQAAEQHQSLASRLKQDLDTAVAELEQVRGEAAGHKEVAQQQTKVAEEHQSLASRLKQDLDIAVAKLEQVHGEAAGHKEVAQQQTKVAEEHQSLASRLKQDLDSALAKLDLARREAAEHKEVAIQQTKVAEEHQSIASRFKQDLATVMSKLDLSRKEAGEHKQDAAQQVQKVQEQMARVSTLEKALEAERGKVQTLGAELEQHLSLKPGETLDGLSGIWARLKFLARNHRGLLAGTGTGGMAIGAIVSAIFMHHPADTASELGSHIDALVAAAEACLRDGQRSCALAAAQAAADDQASDPRVRALLQNPALIAEKQWRAQLPPSTTKPRPVPNPSTVPASDARPTGGTRGTTGTTGTNGTTDATTANSTSGTGRSLGVDVHLRKVSPSGHVDAEATQRRQRAAGIRRRSDALSEWQLQGGDRPGADSP